MLVIKVLKDSLIVLVAYCSTCQDVHIRLHCITGYKPFYLSESHLPNKCVFQHSLK